MRAAWLCMLLYPLVTIFQGFDVTDFGFGCQIPGCLTVRKRVLPADAGGVCRLPLLPDRGACRGWHALVGGTGVVSFKLLFVLLVWCTQGIAWIA